MFAQAAIQACSQTNSAEKESIQARPLSLSLACPTAAGYQAHYIPALCAFFIYARLLCFMYASSGENSCVGAASSVSLEGERELISVGEVEQNAKRSERCTCEQTGAADQGLPQLLHYHNTQKQHLACCYCSNLKTDCQDLHVLSLSSR